MTIFLPAPLPGEPTTATLIQSELPDEDSDIVDIWAEIDVILAEAKEGFLPGAEKKLRTGVRLTSYGILSMSAQQRKDLVQRLNGHHIEGTPHKLVWEEVSKSFVIVPI